MIKKERYVGLGLDQDTAPDKRQTDVYWDAENIRIVNNGRNLSIKPIKGETLLVSIPCTPPFAVIGSTEISGTLVLFGTELNGDDSIFTIAPDGTLTTIAQGNFSFDDSHLIEAIANYESEEIIKVYWVDGINQLRVINIVSSSIISDSNSLNAVKEIDYSNINTQIQVGGNLLAGKVQYAYSLYNLNGSETKISPLSVLVPVAFSYYGSTEDNKGYGGDSGEMLNLSVLVSIPDIDQSYDYIRLFSIHFQELNQTPKITLIADEKLSSSSFSFVDDGNAFVAEYGVEQFLFLGSDPIHPNTLESKKNHLFLANYSETGFDLPELVDGSPYDCRIFGFNSAQEIRVKDVEGTETTYTLPEDVPIKHDAINVDYNTYKYRKDGTTIGLEGVNFFVDLKIDYNADKKFKKRELYRMGVVFVNKYGQKSPAHWVCDFYNFTADGELHYTLRINNTGIATYGAIGIVGFIPVMVERKAWDRSIVAQGFIVPGANFTYLDDTDVSQVIYPNHVAKHIVKDGAVDIPGDISKSYNPGIDWHDVTDPALRPDNIKPTWANSVQFFYSPEITFTESIDRTTKIRVCGVAGVIADSTSSGTDCSYRFREYKNNQPIDRKSESRYMTSWGTIDADNIPTCIVDWRAYLSNVDVIKYEHVSKLAYAAVEDSDTFQEIDVLGMKLIGDAEAITLLDDSFSNFCSFPNITTAQNVHGEQNIGLSVKYAKAMVIKFADSNWHTDDPAIGYKYFKDKTTISDTKRYLPIIELIRDLPNQYGGFSYEVKSRNEYGIIGPYQDFDNATILPQELGDIVLNWYSINRSNGGEDNNNYIWSLYELVDVLGIETTIQLNGRHDEVQKWDKVNTGIEYRFHILTDAHQLLSAYNQKSSIVKYYALTETYSSMKYFPHRIIATEAKYPGEAVDSWTKILPNEYMDLDGKFGAITRLYFFKNEVIAFQINGVSQIAILPRVQTTGNDGIGVYLGTGQLLHDFTYITDKEGTKVKFSIVDNGDILMFYADDTKEIYLIDGTRISSVLGIKAILENFPITHAIFDIEHNEFLFLSSSAALSYSIDIKKFISRISPISSVWIATQGKKVITIGDTDVYTLYTGSIMPSYIKYLMNPMPIYEKVFHNLEYRLYGQEFDTIEVTNHRNTSGIQTVTAFNKFDIHRMHLPRVLDSRERWRGIYIFVRLTNIGDFSLDDMMLMYNVKG